jgi:hypothetical protein
MGKIEDMLQNVYAYFFHNSKKIEKFVELVDIVETMNQWILRTIKTCWISMSFIAKIVIFQYCALVLKMNQNANIINQVAHNSNCSNAYEWHV